MKRKLLLCALLLLPVLAFAVSASATNLWDIRWDGNELPENGVYDWDLSKVAHAATATRAIEDIDASNKCLHILDKTDGADLSYYGVPISADNTTGSTIEVRWDPHYLAPNIGSDLVMRIASPRGTVQVGWLYTYSNPTKGMIVLSPNSGTMTGGGTTVATNLSVGQFYTCRLIEDGSGGWRLIVKDAQGTTVADKSGSLGAVATSFEMGFGEIQPNQKCEYYVDYAYLEYGGYAPGETGEPVVGNPYFVGVPNAAGDGPDRIRVEWNTSSPCDTKVYYRQQVTGAPGSWKEHYNEAANTNHVVNLDGLNGGSKYECYVESYDALTDARITSGVFTVDVPAQVRILYGSKYGATVTSVGDGSYKFEWRTTMESDSYVYYRPVGSSDWQVAFDPNMVPKFDKANESTTTHYVTVSGLVPNTSYQWYARSTNPAWGEGQTDIMTFTYEYVLSEGPNALPRHDSTTGLGLCAISWTTSLNSTEKVYYRPAGTTTWTEYTSAVEGMAHYVDLKNLIEPGQYEYYVESMCTVDGFGTLASPVKYFETFQEFGGNKLTNPGFETGDKTGWTDFGQQVYSALAQDLNDGFHDAATHSGTYRLYTGSQQVVKQGGVYQKIDGSKITSTGKLYAGMWVLTHEVSYTDRSDWGYNWTEYTDTHVSDYAQIGIDPTGGTDANAATVVWSAPVYSNRKGRPYVPVGVSANVTAGTPATVFCKGISDGTYKQHIVCMDDVWAGQTSAVPVSNVQVVENNPMSVTFKWNTPLPTTSMVQYSWDAADSKWWFAYDDGLVTSHQVTVSNLFIPDVMHKYRLQSISAYGLGLSNDGTFKTAPNSTLVNGDFEATNLKWNLDLGMGQAAIPWVTFPSGASITGVEREGEYAMHGIQASSPTHVLLFEEGYSTAQSMSGVYQRVKVGTQNVGELYMASAKALTYAEAVDPWIVNNRVGIDPRGGTDSTSDKIIWGPWVNTNRQWQDAMSAAIVEEPTPDTGLEPGYITIFLQTDHRWGVSLNLTAFDDVRLFKPQPYTEIGDAKGGPLGWPVDLGHDGNGMIVTKYEALDQYNVGTGGTQYLWVQSDDRSSAFKVNIDRVPDNYNYFRGDRVRIRGIMNRKELMDRYYGELEIVAQKMEKFSEYNTDPAPVYMSNKAVGGGTSGLQRAPRNGSGANNVALLVKTTGEVKAWDVVQGNFMPYSFFIDDGSGLSVSYATKDSSGNATTVTLNGLKIWHPYDDANYQWTMPPVRSKVEVTGVVMLEVVDPTAIIDPLNPALPGVPNGSGDEILIPTIRMRDGLDLQYLQ